MQRVVEDSPSTIQNTFYLGETPTDSTTQVTVRVVRDDGTELVASANATSAGAGTGTYQYTLTTTHTSRVDILTVYWTGTINGTLVTLKTFVEVVGGHYFTIAAARASDSDLASTTKYTTAEIREARDEVEDECEEITGVAWVRRYAKARLSGLGTSALLLPHLQARQVFSVTVDGTAYSVAELADIVVPTSGLVHRDELGVFTLGTHNVVIAYEHGHDEPPSDLRRAALLRLRHRLFAAHSPVPDRATSWSSSEGGTFSLATAGKGNSFTGVPDVDAVYGRYRVVVPALA